MKVICITLESFDCDHPKVIEAPTGRSPEIGNIYTVNDSKEFTGILFYSLIELPEDWHDSRNFAPLSDIDETEMVREKQLVEA